MVLEKIAAAPENPPAPPPVAPSPPFPNPIADGNGAAGPAGARSSRRIIPPSPLEARALLPSSTIESAERGADGSDAQDNPLFIDAGRWVPLAAGSA